MNKLIAVLIASALAASAALAQTTPATAPAKEAAKEAPKDAAKAVAKEAPKDAAKAVAKEAPKDTAKAKDDKKALQKATQDKYMKRTPAAGSSAANIPPPTSEAPKPKRAQTVEEKGAAMNEYVKRSSGALHNPPKSAAKAEAKPTPEAASTK